MKKYNDTPLEWIGDKINYLSQRKSNTQIRVKNPIDGHIFDAVYIRLLRGQESFEGRLIGANKHYKFKTSAVVLPK